MIRTTPTKRKPEFVKNEFKNLQIEQTKPIRPVPVTEIICALIIIGCAIVLANEWGIIKLF